MASPGVIDSSSDMKKIAHVLGMFASSKHRVHDNFWKSPNAQKAFTLLQNVSMMQSLKIPAMQKLRVINKVKELLVKEPSKEDLFKKITEYLLSVLEDKKFIKEIQEKFYADIKNPKATVTEGVNTGTSVFGSDDDDDESMRPPRGIWDRNYIRAPVLDGPIWDNYDMQTDRRSWFDTADDINIPPQDYDEHYNGSVIFDKPTDQKYRNIPPDWLPRPWEPKVQEKIDNWVMDNNMVDDETFEFEKQKLENEYYQKRVSADPNSPFNKAKRRNEKKEEMSSKEILSRVGESMIDKYLSNNQFASSLGEKTRQQQVEEYMTSYQPSYPFKSLVEEDEDPHKGAYTPINPIRDVFAINPQVPPTPAPFPTQESMVGFRRSERERRARAIPRPLRQTRPLAPAYRERRPPRTGNGQIKMEMEDIVNRVNKPVKTDESGKSNEPAPIAFDSTDMIPYLVSKGESELLPAYEELEKVDPSAKLKLAYFIKDNEHWKQSVLQRPIRAPYDKFYFNDKMSEAQIAEQNNLNRRVALWDRLGGKMRFGVAANLHASPNKRLKYRNVIKPYPHRRFRGRTVKIAPEVFNKTGGKLLSAANVGCCTECRDDILKRINFPLLLPLL